LLALISFSRDAGDLAGDPDVIALIEVELPDAQPVR
jgi:hypothetical protein